MIRIANSLSQVLQNPPRHSAYVFDIDETLLYTGRDKYKAAACLTEKGLARELKALKESGHPIILLTARAESYQQETLSQLRGLGLPYDVVLHAPYEVGASGEKVSTKGRVLLTYLKGLSDDEWASVGSLSIFDNEKEHLESVKNALASDLKTKTLSQCLYHYQANTCLLEAEEAYFPKNLNELEAASIRSLGGGTQSAYAVDIDDKHFVLKHGVSEDALKVEVLMNGLYKVLGVNIPALQAYEHIPADIAIKLNLPHTKTTIQLTERIKPHIRQDEAQIADYAAQHFVTNAFLGNIDAAKTDNFIMDKSGAIYLIDAGANFIFRSLGEERAEDSHEISEIHSMRNPSQNKTGAIWFNSLTEESLKQQAMNLLEKRNCIEKIIWDLSRRLDFSPPLQQTIIDGFSHRFESLAERFNLEEMISPKIDKHVTSNTSAGVFTLKRNSDGEVQVLLSKRVRHNWSDNFGGKSDQSDITLVKTAMREVFEESSGQIAYSEEALNQSPFHEITTIDKYEQKHLYRLYFAFYDSPIDILELKDHEHTEHCWVDLTALLESLNNPQLIKEEEKITIAVTTRDGKQIILFPPMYQLLQQPAVKTLLKDYVNHKTLNPAKRGRLGRHIEISDSQSQTKEVSRAIPSLSSINKVKSDVRKTVLSKSRILQDIKSQRKDIIDNTPLQVQEGTLSQSELHLKVILGDKFNERGSIQENVGTYFSRYGTEYSIEDTSYMVSLCVEMIEKERQHPDKVFFYHGCNGAIAYAYEIYTTFYQLLRADKRYTSLRVEHPLFQRLKDIEAFIQYFKEEYSGRLNNYTEGFMALAPSVNLFLFGNHQTPTSHSLSYFQYNEINSNIDLRALFSAMFEPLGIPKSLIEKLLSLYHSVDIKNNGALYQLILSPKEADTYGYTAGVTGVLNPLRSHNTHKPSEVLGILRAALKTNTLSEYSDYISNVQARLMTPPHLNLKVRKTYWKGNHALIAEAIKEQGLLQLIQEMGEHYLIQHDNTNEDSQNKTPMSFQYAEALRGAGIQLRKAHCVLYEEIEHLVINNKTEDIIHLVENNPSLLTTFLPSLKRATYTRAYNSRSSIDCNPKTLFGLLVESPIMTDCLYTLFGEHYYEGRIDKSNLDNIVQHIKPSNLEHFATVLLNSNIMWTIDGSALMWAMRKGQKKIALALIKNGASIDEKDKDGDTSLIWAVRTAQKDIALKLIEKGAIIDEKDKDGHTSLIWAVRTGGKDIALELIEKGASIDEKDKNGNTALFWASKEAKIEIALALIEKGASLNEKNMWGSTPLSLAVEKDCKALAALLIEKGASIDEKDNLGCTPLFVAVINDCKELVELLIEKGASIDEKDNLGNTPLMNAVEKGHKEMALTLIEKGASIDDKDEQGSTLLIKAVWRGHKEIVLILIEKGVSVNKKCKRNCSPLFWAIINGHNEIALILIQNGASLSEKDKDDCTPIFWAVTFKRKEIALALIEKGVNLNEKSKDGNTALILAIKRGVKEIALALIQNGASLNEKDNEDSSPLFWAIYYQEKEIALALIEKGVNLDGKNSYGNSPLIWAVRARQKDIALKLIEKGASLDEKDSFGNTALISAAIIGDKDISFALITKGASLDEINNEGCTFLQMASYDSKSLKAVLTLLLESSRLSLVAVSYELKQAVLEAVKKWACIDAKDNGGTSALILAVSNRQKEIALALIENGARLNEKNKYGDTALIWAIKTREKEIALALIKKRANLNKKNNSGDTALICAVRTGDSEIAIALIENGARIDEKNKDGFTALVLAVCNGYKQIGLALIEKGASFDLKKNDVNTVLQRIAHTPKSLKAILVRLSEEDKVEALCCLVNENSASLQQLSNILHEIDSPLCRLLSVLPLKTTEVQRSRLFSASSVGKISLESILKLKSINAVTKYILSYLQNQSLESVNLLNAYFSTYQGDISKTTHDEKLSFLVDLWKKQGLLPHEPESKSSCVIS